MEAEVSAYRAEPDPVGYSSADGEVDEDEQVLFYLFMFLKINKLFRLNSTCALLYQKILF